jgi:hypothetical protein
MGQQGEDRPGADQFGRGSGAHEIPRRAPITAINDVEDQENVEIFDDAIVIRRDFSISFCVEF